MANNNLILLERFNGDLSSWTLDTTGGAVSIVTQDYSTKLKLDDTGGSGIVSALRTFNEPSGKWILEYDINHAASSVGILELLDASNNPIVTIDLGTTATTLSFSTDTAAASTAAFAAAVYKQVILVVDNSAHTVKCYITGSASYPGDSLTQVGGSKSYSGVAIAKLRFKTGVSTTGIVYIDEVKIYTPDIFMIGDSITDGKFYWSTNPGSGYRLAAKEDETSPPSYQLSQMLGSSVWVANRSFGSARSADVDSVIQSNVIDHHANAVYLGIGTNDIYDSTALTTIQTNINSILTTLQNAGITGINILIGNIIPRSTFTAAQNSERRSLNRWLYSRAKEIGAKYIDLNDALKSSSNENAIDSTFAETDGVHLNPTGSRIFASTLGAQLTPYNGINVVRGAYGASDERLFPQGYAPVPVGRTATAAVDFTNGVFITRTSPADFVNAIIEARSMNLEWLGPIPVGRTAQFQIEFLNAIIEARSVNLEWLGPIAVGQTVQFPVEWGKLVAQNRGLNLEWLGGVTVGRAAQLPVDFSNTVNISRNLNLEWLSSSGILSEPNALTGVYRFVHEPSRASKIVHSPSATGKVVK